MNMRTTSCLLAAIAAFGNFFVSGHTWAAEIDCSGTKVSKAAPFSETIWPGDRADHKMMLAIRTHEISSKDPDFDKSEQTVYALQDEYGHAGTQTGYFMYTLKSGEKIWAKFDSVDSMIGTRDSWEFTYQGVFRFIKGTGKYIAIRGGGHYKGKVRSTTGFAETFVCSMEY